jgi:hypothetical protein
MWLVIISTYTEMFQIEWNLHAVFPYKAIHSSFSSAILKWF